MTKKTASDNAAPPPASAAEPATVQNPTVERLPPESAPTATSLSPETPTVPAAPEAPETEADKGHGMSGRAAVVSLLPGGHRRAGLRFGAAPTVIDAADLTAEQVAALQEDTNLRITPVSGD